jgi:2-amino-4-hydroxy-6-hydroxymethyldihydropteridine diphosphokinase
MGVVAAVSDLYRTRAVGPDQPAYLNAVLVLECGCGPQRLLQACHEIERAEGRDRSSEPRWGPRTLDLDLLLLRRAVVASDTLEIPHPRFPERAFALAPAADVAPGWVHPLLGRSVADLAAAAIRREPDAVTKIEW